MTQVKRVLWLVAGWAFILLGIVGLFVPFFQGVLCLMIGLIILSSEYVWAHRLLGKVRERFPRIAGMADRMKEKAVQWFPGTRGTEGV
jgi:uncharacterized membrane protein YbaN (DUF454 family)